MLRFCSRDFRFLLMVLSALGAAMLWTPPAAAQRAGPNPRIVETQCRTCHASEFAARETNPHSVLDSDAWAERTGQPLGCIGCHGDVSTHISERGGTGNVFAFRDEPPTEIIGRCLGCHAGTHPEFDLSAHARAGLSCVDCHSQHGSAAAPTALLRRAADALGRLERLGEKSSVCVDCHEDIYAAFDLNERHRLREGVLECVSCHDPHAPATRVMLGGFKREQCVDCHTDKGGPFVFEHPASRVEGCTACHSPHGSANRHLLSHQRVAETCIGCHAALPQFHIGSSPPAPTRFSLATQCTNCHSAIHGSNFDSHFLR